MMGALSCRRNQLGDGSARIQTPNYIRLERYRTPTVLTEAQPKLCVRTRAGKVVLQRLDYAGD